MADETQLETLKRAYYAGVREVSYDGKKTVYQSAAEMRRAISDLERELARPVMGPRPRFGLVSYGRGDR